MKRLLGITAIIVVSTVAFGFAQGKRVSPAQLIKAGWTCEYVAGATHCGNPGDEASGTSSQFLVFDTTDATSASAPFLGTELLISADVFADQPCPQDGGTYTLIPFLNLYFCHHYDTSF